jgi:replication factor A1
MELEEIIGRIVGETGMEEGEVRGKIEEKQKELGGLVTPIGAAHIIANEAGVNLLEGLSKINELKIENIIPNMNSVDVVGRVTRIFPAREFEKADKTKGRVASLILADETGTIRVVFWGKDVALLEDKIEEGDVLRIREGYTKESINGEAEIHIGVRARVIINPKDVDKEEIPLPEQMTKKIAELGDGMPSVDVVCRVMRIYEVREFEREDKTKGKVANLVVGDETGVARLVLWDEDVGLVEKGQIKEGDIIKVKKGYVKVRYEEPEINVGKYGKLIVNPPEEEVGQIPEIPGVARVERKSLSELKDGEKAEIRGALVEVYDNLTLFDRAEGKGMVINAVIDDGTANMRAAFYDTMAEALLNITLAEACEGDVQDKILERRGEILGREVVATVRVKHSDFTGRNELVVQDLNLSPDPKQEGEGLLKEAKSLQVKEEK